MDNTNQLDILIIFASHAALNKRLGRAQTSSPRSYNPAYAAWQPAQGFVAFQRLSCHRRCPGSKREWRGYARDGRARDEGAQMLGTESPIAQHMTINQVVQLPDASSIAEEIRNKPVVKREHPAGLKMRFRPYGFDTGVKNTKATVVAEPDSSTSAKKERKEKKDKKEKKEKKKRTEENNDGDVMVAEAEAVKEPPKKKKKSKKAEELIEFADFSLTVPQGQRVIKKFGPLSPLVLADILTKKTRENGTNLIQRQGCSIMTILKLYEGRSPPIQWNISPPLANRPRNFLRLPNKHSHHSPAFPIQPLHLLLNQMIHILLYRHIPLRFRQDDWLRWARFRQCSRQNGLDAAGE
ncbi:hypothetical protein BC938DRAFT_473859 [Jimgerdemannia flammicorona]|uniref:Uncharacterized protein n=1 Tax=Jimgerdemannia flammicorona TaxID=994334 RepID=A0A433Q3E0_9FUNG|nr:hypothetical protein BC938DRAFT_473859 [Jimgerdemannia flammicorona]